MKRVLFVRGTSIYNDSRATKEIKALLESGHFVTVLGWNREGIALEKVKDLFNSSNLILNFFDERLNHGSGFRGLFKTIKFNHWIKKYIKKNKKNIDVVHLCDLDTAFFSYKTLKKNKIKFIYDIYDYYADSRNFPLLLDKYVRYKENQIISIADKVIICTEQRYEQIKKGNPKSFEVIYNTPEQILINGQRSLISSTFEKFKIKTAFIGALTENRLLKEIIDFLNNKDKHTDILWVFAGQGYYSDQIKELSLKKDNVIFFGPLPYYQVLDIQQNCDFLFALYNPNIKNHKYSAPNKVYEAMMLGKPVIVCKNTGIDLFVSENKIGFVIDYSVNELISVIEFIKNNQDIVNDMGKRARQLYEEKYNWNKMKEKLNDIYNNI